MTILSDTTRPRECAPAARKTYRHSVVASNLDGWYTNFDNPGQNHMLEVFKTNLSHWLTIRDISRAELSRRAGYNANKATSILNGSSVPSITVALKFANVLDIRADDLLYPQPDISVEMTQGDARWKSSGAERAISNRLRRQLPQDTGGSVTDFLLDWQGATNGDLSQLGDLRSKIEVFDLPDLTEMLPRPKEVGKLSLAASRFGIKDASLLRKMFEASDRNIATAVAESHFRALNGEAKVDYFRIDVADAGKVVFGVDYRRILMRAFDRAPEGSNTYIVNFSQPLWYLGEPDNESFQLTPRGQQKPVLTRLGTGGHGPAVRTLCHPG